MKTSGLFRLDGKVALVTGASSGLGASFAASLAEAGADIVLAARRVDKLAVTSGAVREFGRQALVVATDVSSRPDCFNAAEQAIARFGRIDILVNNAGMASAVPAMQETAEEFDRVVKTNLHGSYYMAQACASHMTPGSSIINISSVLGLTTAGLPQAAYSSSKSAIIGLTRDLAQQWTRRRGIRVNAIAPGFFPSEMTDGYAEGYKDRLAERILLGREGDPAELGAAVVFLASPAAAYITAQTLVVDGGFTAT